MVRISSSESYSSKISYFTRKKNDFGLLFAFITKYLIMLLPFRALLGHKKFVQLQTNESRNNH